MAQDDNRSWLGLAAKLLFSLLITLALFVTALIVTLHTPAGFSLLQKGFERVADYRIAATEFKYDFRKPLTFYFENLSIDVQNNQRVQIEEINLTLAPIESVLRLAPVLDELWIKGSTFGQSSAIKLPESLIIKELSLENINLEHHAFSLSNADVQLANWKNDGNIGAWNGSFMFSAEHAKVMDETFDELLLNGIKKDNNWQFWSVVISSRLGKLNASAGYDGNAVVFEHLSLKDASIQPAQTDQPKQFYTRLSDWVQAHQISIKRLDLVNMQAALADSSVERLNLTGYDLLLDKGKLDRTRETVSAVNFTAESANFRQLAASDVSGEISFSKQGINISSLSSRLMENGYLNIKGDILEQAVNLTELSIDGLEMAINADEVKILDHYWQDVTSFKVDKLAIKRTDLIVAEPNFPVEVTDLSVQGTDVSMVNRGSQSFWQGSLKADAKTAEINQIALLNPIVNAVVDKSQWQFNAELPFMTGQLKLNAQLNTANPSHPWQVRGEGLVVPTNVYQQWFNVQLPVQGEHDIELDLNGLAVTKDALRFSLSGTLNATLHNSLLHPTEDQPLAQELAQLLLPKTPIEQPRDATFEQVKQEVGQVTSLKAGKIRMALHRGQLTLEPLAVSTDDNQIILQGKWDFVNQQGGFTSQ